MRKLTSTAVAMAMAMMTLTTTITFAQPPGGRGAPDGRGPGGPPNRLLEALDADGDREISKSELENAVAALKKLDRNGDGKLTFEDLRPEGADGRGPRGQGRPDQERGAPERGNRERGDRDAPREGRPTGEPRRGEAPREGRGDQSFGERLMSFDENKDGKLSKEELPERMRVILERHDANKDGSLDKQELANLTRPPAGDVRGRDGRGAREGSNRDGSNREGGTRDGGNREGGNREGGNREGRPREGEGAGPGQRGPGFGGPPNPEQFVNFAMSFDADDDGKLSKEELVKMAEQFGRRGGPRGPGGGRPDGNGQRPQRPNRPNGE